MDALLLIWSILLTIAFAVLRNDIRPLRQAHHWHGYTRNTVDKMRAEYDVLQRKYDLLLEDRGELKGRVIALENQFSETLNASSEYDNNQSSLPLKLYIWENILTDGQKGVGVALADSIESARQYVLNSQGSGNDYLTEHIDYWADVREIAPIGFIIWGDI